MNGTPSTNPGLFRETVADAYALTVSHTPKTYFGFQGIGVKAIDQTDRIVQQVKGQKAR